MTPPGFSQIQRKINKFSPTSEKNIFKRGGGDVFSLKYTPPVSTKGSRLIKQKLTRRRILQKEHIQELLVKGEQHRIPKSTHLET